MGSLFHPRVAWPLALALTTSGSAAQTARGAFAVTATVAAVARVQQLEQPDRLEVSSADARRGWIELPTATTTLSVRTNHPSGYLLDIAAPPGLFSAIEVRWADQRAVLAGDGGTLAQRDGSLRLGYRLRLLPGTAPGVYAWPLRVSARPLPY